MYVSGNISNYASRMHQLAVNSGVLDSFITEGNGYLSSAPRQLAAQWEKEARMSKFRYSRNPASLVQPIFGSQVNPSYGKPVLSRVYSTGTPNQVSWTYSGTTPPGGFVIYEADIEEFSLATSIDEIPAGNNTYGNLSADKHIWLSPIDAGGQLIGTVSEPLLMRNAVLITGAGNTDVNTIYIQNETNSPIWGDFLVGRYIDSGSLYFEGDIQYSAPSWPDPTSWATELSPPPAPTGYFV